MERSMVWIWLFKDQVRKIISLKMGINIASMSLSDSRKSSGEDSEQKLFLGFKIQLAIPASSVCCSLVCNPYRRHQSQFAPLLSFFSLSSGCNETQNSASLQSFTALLNFKNFLPMFLSSYSPANSLLPKWNRNYYDPPEWRRLNQENSSSFPWSQNLAPGWFYRKTLNLWIETQMADTISNNLNCVLQLCTCHRSVGNAGCSLIDLPDLNTTACNCPSVQNSWAKGR